MRALPALLTALLLLDPTCLPQAAAGQVQTWRVGLDGRDWLAEADITAAVDTGPQGELHPSGFTASDNILRTLSWRDGSPSDYTQEGQPRVWDNAAIAASNVALVDGKPSTSTEDRFTKPGVNQTGRIFYVDLGASYPANRVVFYPSPGNEDLAIHAFELSVSDGRSFSQHARPIYEVLRRVEINPEPRVDLRFPVQLVRFIKLRVLVPNAFELAEIELYGEGYVPEAQFVSRFIEFDKPVNFGHLTVSGDHLGPDPAQAVLAVRNGSDTTPSIYYRKDLETQKESVVSKEEYENLVDREKGPIRYDSENWSQWSRALVIETDGSYTMDLTSLPGPRRYFQFRIDFTGTAAARVAVPFLEFTYSEALASQALAEVGLRGQPVGPGEEVLAPTGEPAVFVLGVRGVFEHAGYAGFDGIRLATPSEPDLLDLRLGDTLIEPDSVLTDSTGMRVYFPGQRMTAANSMPIWLTFRTTPLLYNTLFGGWLLDTQGGLPQPLSAGDAGIRVNSSSLNVYGSLGSPLRLFELTAPVVTPNGDNVNDLVEVRYELIHLVHTAQVDLCVCDLAGRRVTTVYAGAAAAGLGTPTWDGRRDRGDLVPPGQYLCRLEVETQSKTIVRVIPLAVVY